MLKCRKNIYFSKHNLTPLFFISLTQFSNHMVGKISFTFYKALFVMSGKHFSSFFFDISSILPAVIDCLRFQYHCTACGKKKFFYPFTHIHKYNRKDVKWGKKAICLNGRWNWSRSYLEFVFWLKKVKKLFLFLYFCPKAKAI